MKNILILLGLLGIPLLSHSQGTSLNHTKYWFYRYRLTNEFMVKGRAACGTPAGYSIPAANNYQPENLAGPVFGDGTSYLGYYIGVLATEHKLLVDHGGKPEQLKNIREELYNAMLAYERLDRNAEKLLAPKEGDNCGDNLNGFFMRDDVPADDDNFKLKFKRPYKLNSTTLRNVKSDYVDCVDEPVSSFIGSNGKTPFPSQDQITDLFVGFSLVRKLMAGYNYNSYDFSSQASIYVGKIMDYLYSNNYQIKIPNNGSTVKFGGIEVQANSYGIARAGQRIVDNNWGHQIIPSGQWENTTTTVSLTNLWSVTSYPLTGVPIYEFNWVTNDYNNAILSSLAAIGNSWEVGFQPVKAISSTIPVPWPKGTCKILGDGYRDQCMLWIPPVPLVSDGHCAWTEKVWFPIYLDCPPQQVPIEIWCYNNTAADLFTDATLIAIIAGTGPAVATNAGTPVGIGLGLTGAALALAADIVPNAGLCAPFKLPKLTVNTTGLALSAYGSLYGNELFPVLHKVLHNQGPYNYTASSLVDIMNTAPCTGPHYKPIDDPYTSPTSEGAPGWYQDNRFQKANQNMHHASAGANTGLDYMLLHNLYLLAHGSNNDYSEIGAYIDKMNIMIANKTYNSVTETVQAMASVESTNSLVNIGSNITYKAGDSIILDPGFTVAPGANFEAYLKLDLPCSSYTGQKVVTPSTSEVKQTFDTTAYVGYLRDLLAEELKQQQPALEAAKAQHAYEPMDQYINKHKNNSSSKPNTSSLNRVRLYPNPTTGTITIDFMNTSNQSIEMEVKNELGRTVLDKIKDYANAGPYSRTIQTSSLPASVYYLEVKTNDGLKVYKFVKQ